MKKYFLMALVAMSVLTACDNDDYEGAAPGAVSASYFNRMADGSRANLDLTYSGDTLIGKVVSLTTTDTRTARMTLNRVLPHEDKTVIDGVKLVYDGEKGYNFSGTTTSELGTVFGYDGTVDEGHLTLNIKDVKIPGGAAGLFESVKMTGGESVEIDGKDVTMYHFPFTILSENGTVSQVGSMASLMGGFLNYLWRDVTFEADGNVTATYAELPDSLLKDQNKLTEAIMSSISDGLTRPDSDYKKSPKNLATWFRMGDTIYVTPNVDMIIRQVQMDHAATRAASVTDYLKMYQTVQRWATTGIKLTLKPNPYSGRTAAETYQVSDGTLYAYEGDYMITLSKDEFAPFLVLLTPELADQIVASAGDMGAILGGILKPLFDALGKAERVDVTLFLNKK